MKLAIVSLGCPKNQADADVFARALIEAGHDTVATVAEADAVIVNTCGFIEAAKLEAIEEILSAAQYKRENPDLKVVVTGCLAERYKGDIAAQMPEVDAVVGIGKNADLPKIVAEVCGQGKPGEDTAATAAANDDKAFSATDGDASRHAALQCYGPKTDLPLGGRRVISTPAHYAWLKIAEGCLNCCSYCAIPSIRGPLRSRTAKDVLAEAEWLAGQGVKEIVLVAQDVTAFGLDRGAPELPALLDALQNVDGVHWIRMLYTYPDRIDAAVLDAVKRNSKILPYFDMPIQHINDEILESMRRRGNGADVCRALDMVRAAIPDATLRTTLIAGYPGEDERKFSQLCEFVAEAQFDHLGCFAYSPEEGTAASAMPGMPDEDERRRREGVIMDIQSRVSEKKLAAHVGEVMEVLCDGLDEESGYWLCRGAAHAPEIDESVLVESAAPLETGKFYQVKITGADVYDLYAMPAE